MILIAGYGLTGMAYYKLINQLRRHFRLMTLDLLGMGGSGRPKFDLKTSRDCVQYFVQSLEAFFRLYDEIYYMR